MKTSDRDKLESKITEKLLLALNDDPTASMLKTAIEWLSITDRGVVSSPGDKQQRQAEKVTRTMEKWAGRLPFPLPEDQREKLSEPFKPED